MTSNGVTPNGEGDGQDADSIDGASRTTRIVILSLLALFLLAGVGAIIAAVGLFGSDNGTTESSEATTVGSSSSSSSSSSPETTSGGSPGPLEDAATTPVSVPFPVQDMAKLADVRVAGHDGFDRVVLEFDGQMPGYVVKYVPGPLTGDQSDLPISLKGSKILQVTTSPASGFSVTEESYDEVYTGPLRIAGPGSPVAEVVRSGDFEAVLSWAIGTNGEKPFKVTTLKSPTRLVIDVKA